MIAASAPGAASLLVELGGILLLLAVLGRLAARIGLPVIPLYLLAGLAIGEGGIVELVTARDFIETGSQIGVILLLLLLGLEYTGSELTGALRNNAPAGAMDFVLNFTPGLAVGLLLGWDVRAALLLGGITYISSSGIIARLLEDLGNTGNRETPIVLAVLVTEDLVMALYLPLMAGLLVGGGSMDIAMETGVALAAVAIALAAAVHLGGPFSRMIFNVSSENLLLSILGVALLVSGIAEELQASAAVGAFLVGIALSGRAGEGAREVLGPLRDLFAALFFVFFGLQIDPSQLSSALGIALALAVVTAGTKLATGWWAAAQAGIRWQGRLRTGTTLVARGEFSIVIAGIAVTAGIEADIGPLAAAYVLILAIAGPLLARASDPMANAILARRARREAAAGT